ncbi:uncharacterized protein LOC125645737 [Ostrea edulis]|uniref:uncharacterized protein LOC125645737 n=1 Tax=Ostrea edulis TaxID=37623 RepID=UPI0024AFCC7B|nr:uncharacterized protein LOC125645737 [Ostrea edulis]
MIPRMKIFQTLVQFSRFSWKFNNYSTCNLLVKKRVEYSRKMFCYNRVPAMLYCNLSILDVKKRTEELSDCFMEARELMQDAVASDFKKGSQDSMNTVYFSEDMKEAAEAVAQTIQMYENFLNELNENQKKEVTRTIGLKMAELKAQYAAMEETLKTE